VSEYRVVTTGPGWRHIYDHERSEPVPKGTIGRDRDRTVRAWNTLCGVKLTTHSTRDSRAERDNPFEEVITCDKCLREWAAIKLATTTIGDEGDDIMRRQRMPTFR
jgi:hypothetical protein